jgi:hypothetical protein
MMIPGTKTPFIRQAMGRQDDGPPSRVALRGGGCVSISRNYSPLTTLPDVFTIFAHVCHRRRI